MTRTLLLGTELMVFAFAAVVLAHELRAELRLRGEQGSDRYEPSSCSSLRLHAAMVAIAWLPVLISLTWA